MSFDAEKRDLRIIKTEKSLYEATHTLLTSNAFRKITVRDICEEALVSRATFYSYYMDKYDLLRHWLITSLPKDFGKPATYEAMEKPVNEFAHAHKIMIKNILEDADSETITIVLDCILNLFEIPEPPKGQEKFDSKYIVVSNLLAGGIMQYLQWHIKNRFPIDLMNREIYNILYDVVLRYRNDKL